MADWRQIQARIRKAKNATDPLVKLSELYLRTRDGMVAWELATIYEKNGQTEEAVKWYKAAWERFRRSDWKKKAEESLTRLGEEVPATAQGASTPAAEMAEEQEHRAEESAEEQEANTDEAVGQEELAPRAEMAAAVASRPAAGGASEEGFRGKRRRGRRGGRGRNRRGEGSAASEGSRTAGLPPRAFAGDSENAAGRRPSLVTSERPSENLMPREPVRQPASMAAETPMLPSERAAHGHRDPGLASRMAQLESMLRRLVGSPLHRLDDVDEAPAGPGVFLLSDSDQTGYYYVEACQTLRVGLGNLVRGGTRGNRGNMRGGRSISDADLKAKLAEHLEINESKVAQYLKDHCVVRWI
ncbi:MAG TPA: hypothetical protein VMU43_08470, partial [Candidatus Acidoferrum sp.]|nr:hypothetical protein [Candidatus Acidoferrum sp.]